ncbi:phosphoenolpyruvate synthase, partial [Candidatus Uhrbacteria bacterium]|nr:phosphoenolpyruvate synthase [Candidatus Uhrbacteria bacterium]
MPLEQAGMDDVDKVGGKNASLGEMLHELSGKGIRVPSGFIVTAESYRLFIREAGLEKFIRSSLKGIVGGDLRSLESVSAEIRARIKSAPIPFLLQQEIIAGYRGMEKEYGKNIDVAIRSSATAEDLPDASFAGEHDTYLGVRGHEDVVRSVKSCFASLFTARAIS